MDFFKSKRMKVLLGVVAVLFGVMMYSASSDGIASMPERLLSYITVPFQKLSSSISNAGSDFFGQFTQYEETKQKNEALQAEIDELREELIDYEAIKKQNELLKNMTGLKEEHPDFSFVSASIVGSDPSNGYEQFTIDQGSMHGVSVNDPVLTSSGLVGIVEEVGTVHSVVTTLLSPKIKVGAYVVTNDEQLGVVNGNIEYTADGLCTFHYLETRPKEGDLIASSGSSGLYPRGLVIGMVESVHKQESGTSYYAVIQPANDIAELRDVFVLVDFLGNDETE